MFNSLKKKHVHNFFCCKHNGYHTSICQSKSTYTSLLLVLPHWSQGSDNQNCMYSLMVTSHWLEHKDLTIKTACTSLLVSPHWLEYKDLTMKTASISLSLVSWNWLQGSDNQNCMYLIFFRVPLDWLQHKVWIHNNAFRILQACIVSITHCCRLVV